MGQVVNYDGKEFVSHFTIQHRQQKAIKTLDQRGPTAVDLRVILKKRVNLRATSNKIVLYNNRVTRFTTKIGKRSEHVIGSIVQ